METNVWQYYKNNYPGQVQVLGCDVLDGTVAQLRNFRTQAGVSYPLLLKCYVSVVSSQNFVTWYGERDNFVVINQRGIVRYRAAQTWPYGNGYHLSEIRGCVDSLVVAGLGVDDAPPANLELSCGASPGFGPFDVALALPRDESVVRVAVHDLAGRRIATLYDGPARAGRHAFAWDPADTPGPRPAPGVYLLVAEAGAHRVAHRLVLLR